MKELRPLLGQMDVVNQMWWMPFAGFWVNKALKLCVQKKWKTLFSMVLKPVSQQI